VRRTELFGALRERQFRLLWLGQATSTLGDGLVPVALAFAVIGTLDRGVLLVPSVRNLRRLDEPEPEPAAGLSNVTGEPVVEAFRG
jgi:hypothetical protein